MNKRIEELAVSSGIYDSLCDPYDALKNGDYYSSIKIDLEKFAELIVQECAKSANDWYQNHDKIHSDPMSYVLAHFGVEE